MSRKVLIFYPEINLHEQTRAGGLEHLLANVVGYTENGYRVFVVGAYNRRIVEKDEDGNVYFNIIYAPQRKSIDLEINSINDKKNIPSKKIRIKKSIKFLLDTVYQFIIFLLVFFLKIDILHERSTKRFKKIFFIKKIFPHKKYIYEMNDELFHQKSLEKSDINLVVDKKFFPKGYKYYSSPWPINFQNNNNNTNRYKNRIVYLGSVMSWHGFDKMVDIVKALGDEWKIDVYGPDIASDTIDKLHDRVVFKGFVKNKDISSVLSQYRFGFAIYNNIYGSDRNKVGSPMKVAHYLYNNVIPITNMMNDEKLKKESIIIMLGEKTTQEIKKLSMKYDQLYFNKDYLVSQYSPKNYYKRLLMSI